MVWDQTKLRWRESESMDTICPHGKHILQGFKKVHFIFPPVKTERGGEDITSCFREWGGFHPRGWISPPCPYCQIREGGDITPRVEIYEKGGGFHPRGGYHPLVLIWPQSTGGVQFFYEYKYHLTFDHKEFLPRILFATSAPLRKFG